MICSCGEEHRGPGNWCPECIAYEESKRSDRRAERIQRSGLPAKYQGIGYPQSDLADAARLWVDGAIEGLVLTGGYGAGKTWLAGAAAWDRLQKRCVAWVDVARLMNGLRSGFGTKSKAEADALVQGAGAVILDDLDKVTPTDYGRETILATLNGRADSGAPVLVTTNLPISQIAQKYDEAIASRLAGFVVIKFSGPDRRLAAASRRLATGSETGSEQAIAA